MPRESPEGLPHLGRIGQVADAAEHADDRVEGPSQLKLSHVGAVQAHSGQTSAGYCQHLLSQVDAFNRVFIPQIGKVLSGAACDIEQGRGIWMALPNQAINRVGLSCVILATCSDVQQVIDCTAERVSAGRLHAHVRRYLLRYARLAQATIRRESDRGLPPHSLWKPKVESKPAAGPKT